MARRLKIGLALPLSASTGSGVRPLAFADVLGHARAAESLGFDSVWISDHFFVEGADGARRGTLEAWTLLTALAARTEHVLLGTLVLCNGLRHPALLARMAASLQEISAGRLILGLGAGWHEAEYHALGLGFDHRFARFAETLTALTELLREGRSSFTGRYLRLDNAGLIPRSESPPPVWVAGSGPRMLRLTAELADGCNFAWYGADLERFASLRMRLAEEEAAAGREFRALEVSAGLQVVLTPEGERFEQTRTRISQAMPRLENATEDRLRRAILIGPASDCAAVLRRYADAGAEHLIVSLAPRPFALLDHGGIERFAETVLLALR